MKKFKYEIISGVPHEEIRSYFSSLSEDEDYNTRFLGKGWEVKIEYKGSKSLGSIEIPQTSIIFLGDRKICTQLIYDFRIKFLSAGG